MPSFEAELEAAIEAAHEAARIIKRHAGRVQDDHVRDKGLHDIVTIVDEEAQHAIVDLLGSSFPNHAVLAEEDAPDEQVLRSQGFQWIIDPIDGTTNFLHGIPPYAVSIGLQHNGEVVLGVVLDVAHDELFTAVRGGGLFVNGRRCRASRTKDIGQALVTTGFPYRAFDRVDGYLASLRRLMHDTRGLRRPGAASVDLAYVACGRFDAFFETHLSPWDVAAGIVLVEEGGGRVTDLDLHTQPIHGRDILATNGLLHDAMHERLGPLRATR